MGWFGVEEKGESGKGPRESEWMSGGDERGEGGKAQG